MATDIPDAFIRQYEREVHEAYQRQGSLLRPMVRTKSNVRGESTTFQKVGRGTATTKTRHGVITPMNVDHTPVTCTLVDYYAGDWVDKLDELKINIDERKVVADASAWALGRKTDDLILTAMDTATNANTITMTTSITFRNGILDAIQELRTLDVPTTNLFGVVSPEMWNWFLLISQFSDADFIGSAELPFATGRMMKNWNGINWMAHPGVPRIGTSTEFGAIWHQSAIGFASGADVSSDMMWYADHASHWISNSMSQGACLIDAEGIVELVLDATAALPTS